MQHRASHANCNAVSCGFGASTHSLDLGVKGSGRCEMAEPSEKLSAIGSLASE